jgi:N utilization substance protein B
LAAVQALYQIELSDSSPANVVGEFIERLEIILRSILRAGAYEILARPEVPVRVAISEYLDIAHAFFAGKEPGLINGVLDRLARTARSDGMRGEARGSGPAS